MKKTPEEIIKQIVSYVGWLLVFAALGFYVYGITEAIRKTMNGEVSAYPEFLSTTIGSIQALLLTNLGMLLGISIANPRSPVAAALKLSGGKPKLAMAPPSPVGSDESPTDLRERIQLFALIIYIFSLIACLVTWIAKDFKTDAGIVVSIISESGKMFIGVVLAYLTAVLNKS